MYPVFLNLTGRRVLLVGGGQVAAGKLAGLLADGALVTVVAPEVRPELHQPGVAINQRPFVPADLDDVWYVVAAAPPAINKDVLDAAEHRHVFVNAVDDPAHASAYAGSVVRRAGVTIAFSTDGRAPALAGLLREALDAWLPADLDTWMVASVTWSPDGRRLATRRAASGSEVGCQWKSGDPCCSRRSTDSMRTRPGINSQFPTPNSQVGCDVEFGRWVLGVGSSSWR